MAEGYVYRKVLLDRIILAMRQSPVVLWGPPGFGKTLVLREIARERDIPYREQEGDEPGVYDLLRPPERWRPGQVVALRRRPAGAHEFVLFGPQALAFEIEEAREMARRLKAGRDWRKVWERLGGWPVLVRQAFEHGASYPHEEPLRSWMEALLVRLAPKEREVLGLLRFEPSELAAWRALDSAALTALLERGFVRPHEGRLRLLPALANYLAETEPLPPFAVAERLLNAEETLGDPEAALEGYLRYGAPRASDVFVRAAALWNREGRAEKTVSYWNRLQVIDAQPEAYLAVAEAEYLGGRLQRSLGLYEHVAARHSDRKKRAEALLGLGTVRVRLGRYEEAVEAFREAAKHATPEQQCRAEASLGGALVRIGRYAEAARVLEHARTSAAGVDPRVEARAQHNLGIAYHHMGLLPEAITAYTSSLQIRGEDEPLARANTLLSLGEALRLTGRWEEAERTLKEARRVAEASGEYRSLGYSYLNTGDLYVEAGWLEEAGESYRLAQDLLVPSEDLYGIGLVELGMGRMYARMGRLREAEWRFRKALENLKDGGSPAEHASVWIEQSRLLGDEEAARLLERAESAAKEMGARRVALQARLERLARIAPEFSAQEVEEVSVEVVKLEALPLLLSPHLVPIWLAAGAAAEGGALVYERLVWGWGAVRVHSLGAVRIMRESPVEFFTSKEPWVLFALWLRGPSDPEKLAEWLFPDARNPRKRVQIAVHHVREALGEPWIRRREGAYVADPLPGTWWDLAVLRAALAGYEKVPDWAAEAREKALKQLNGGPLLPGTPFKEEREQVQRELSRKPAPSD